MTQDIEPPIFERIPEPIPDGTIVVEDEAHTFRVYETQSNNPAPKTVYTLGKADVEEVREVRATVNGVERELTKGTDWETRDVTGSGKDDSVAFINSSTYPDEESEFHVTYVAEPIIKTFTDAYSSDVDGVSSTIDEAIDDNQVVNADGNALDEISEIYGPVTVRGGLNDDNFSSLIRSVVPALSANGTVPGMKEAIAVVVDGDPSDVTITEDFTKVGYEVTVSAGARNISAEALNEVIERADPSGVDLLSVPVLVFTDEIQISGTTSTTKVDSSSKLGGGTLGSEQLGG